MVTDVKVQDRQRVRSAENISPLTESVQQTNLVTDPHNTRLVENINTVVESVAETPGLSIPIYSKPLSVSKTS